MCVCYCTWTRRYPILATLQHPRPASDSEQIPHSERIQCVHLRRWKLDPGFMFAPGAMYIFTSILMCMYRYVTRTCIYIYIYIMHILTGWWFQPLWKIWKSVGMMTFPIYGKIKFMFQTTKYLIYYMQTSTNVVSLVRFLGSLRMRHRSLGGQKLASQNPWPWALWKSPN